MSADLASAFQSRGRFLVQPLPSLFPFLDLEKATSHGRRRARTNTVCIRGHDRRHHCRSLMSPNPSKHVRQLVDRTNKREILSRRQKKTNRTVDTRVTSVAISTFLLENRNK